MNSWTLEDYEKNKEKCEEELKNLQDWSQIPAINDTPLEFMTDGSLVRYRGMIQDTLSPEYFYAKYNVKNKETGSVFSRCGRMRDVLHCQESEELQLDDELGLKDRGVRYPLFCVPIPGLNTWTKPSTPNKTTASVSGIKRPLEDDDAMDVEDGRKIRPSEHIKSNASPLQYCCEKYFPLPETGGLACIVKHYGEYEDFLVNARIEVVGFLSLDPALEASWHDSDAEDKAMHPPPSLVPRLHAIMIRKLSHCNPTLPLNLEMQEVDACTIRKDLHMALSQVFFGDSLVADYIICNLLSTVYIRKEGLALGALSINVYNISDTTFPSLLYGFLETLLPNNVYLPLAIDLLNTTVFVPKKNYESNKLESGRLQLPDDTHLLVDETKMTAGTLQNQGVLNMSALHSLTLQQELQYDFNYLKVSFHTDIPVVVLSEGKSLIPTDVPIKLNPDAGSIISITETFEAVRFFLSRSRLDAVRIYLSTLRLRQCDMNNTEFVGPAWAELRQKNEHLQQDDLHRLLVISRLLAISYGRVAVGKDDWDKAVEMEMNRQYRTRL